MVRALDAASAALTAQYQRFARSAARVATVEPPADLVRETTEQMGVAIEAKANIAVIKTEQDMLGTLFDIWA